MALLEEQLRASQTRTSLTEMAGGPEYMKPIRLFWMKTVHKLDTKFELDNRDTILLRACFPPDV